MFVRVGTLVGVPLLCVALGPLQVGLVLMWVGALGGAPMLHVVLGPLQVGVQEQHFSCVFLS